MKLLLDENLPEPLRRYIVGHEVFTVGFLGWKGVSNGELLRQAGEHGFDALIPLDSSMECRHHRGDLPVALVLLHADSHDLDDLTPLVPAMLKALGTKCRRGVIHVR